MINYAFANFKADFKFQISEFVFRNLKFVIDLMKFFPLLRSVKQNDKLIPKIILKPEI